MSARAYPAYRESGVEWIQSIPVGWEAKALRGLARDGRYTFSDGDWVETPYIVDEGIRLLQTGNIGIGRFKEQGFRYISSESFDDLDCTEVDPGDVLICRLAEPVGRACLAPDLGVRMITSVDVCILKLRHEVVSSYLVYLLSSPDYLSFMEGQCRGGTRDRVSRSFLGAIRVPLPSTAEQSAIAGFLDRETGKIDALVAEQEQLIALLKEKRQAVISQAVTKGLDPNAPMKPSGVAWLGEVPAHWRIERARHLFVERDERSEGGDETLLTVSHLTGVTPRSEKTVYMTEAETTEGYKLCFPGDLVINTLWAWMGAMGVADVAGLISPAYNVYSPRAAMDPAYVNAIARMPEFARESSRWSKGVWSSRLRLYPAEFFQIQMPVPSLSEQHEIASLIDDTTARFEALTMEAHHAIALLRERRAALISAAVTGKIDVRDHAITRQDAAA